MRRRLTVTMALVAMLVASLLPTGAATATPRAPEYGLTVTEHIVGSKFGKLYVRVAHPTLKGKAVKAPSIFTYSPYWVLGTDGENFRRSSNDSWVPLGYNAVWADVVGTGNSGGCYDYGGEREKVTGAALVEWIAKQKWSTGKVAMTGGSYEGTTATAAAVMKPKGLVTIVPEAAISRWYGYAYSNGIRYFLNNENPSDEGVDTPAAFDFGLAVPPPLDPDGADFQERFAENMQPCDELEHMQHGYDDTPDYDKFWIERDYLRDAHKIKIPVLVAHNWGDWNVKQEEGWNLFNALTNAEKRVLYMGDRYTGHGTPDGKYDKYKEAWMAHYLKGVDNGIEDTPTIVSEGANYDGPLKYLAADSVKTRDVALIAQEMPRTSETDWGWKLYPDKPLTGMMPTAAIFNSANVNTEYHAIHHARNNHDWYWFESPVLKKDVRIFGRPRIEIQVTADREWITLTPTIVDVKTSCHESVANQHVQHPECTAETGAGTAPRSLYSVTRGWMDSRYRNGLAKQQLAKPMQPLAMTIPAHPTDYTFKKGHQIGLLVATELNEWSVPKPYPCTSLECVQVRINWEQGKTRLILPMVNAPRDPKDLFDLGHHH
ncbi:MAG: CocE/NonD family hydrolase [Actinomycetota bacterium]